MIRIGTSSRLGALVACMMVSAAAAGAQMSLSTVVDLALKHDPKMRAAQANVDKAMYALHEVEYAYIPSASVSGGYGKATGVPLGVPEVFTFQAQSLLFNFSQRDYIRAAEQGLKAAKLAAKDTHDQVAEDAVVSYLDLDHAQARASAIAEEFAAANKLVMIVEDRRAAGVDTELMLLDARITAKDLHYQKLVADDEAAGLTDHLARMIGLVGNLIVTETNSIPPLPEVASISLPKGSSAAIQSLFANAKAKQQTAFGDSRWWLRPQANLFLNYAYIDLGESDYLTYYPNFQGKARDAASVGIQIQIPLFDMGRQNRAKESIQEAIHAQAEAQTQRNVFQEGRAKLLRAALELADVAESAELKQQKAKLQLDIVLTQLTAAGAIPGQPQMTPKDEQNARLQERARYIDLLNMQFELAKAKVNLLRQTGGLDAWLATIPKVAGPSVGETK